MTQPKIPMHRNTDADPTEILPAVDQTEYNTADHPERFVRASKRQTVAKVTDKRKPIDFGAFLAWLILVAGINWTIWIMFDQQAARVLIGTVSLACTVLVVSNGIKLPGGKR